MLTVKEREDIREIRRSGGAKGEMLEILDGLIRARRFRDVPPAIDVFVQDIENWKEIRAWLARKITPVLVRYWSADPAYKHVVVHTVTLTVDGDGWAQRIYEAVTSGDGLLLESIVLNIEQDAARENNIVE